MDDLGVAAAVREHIQDWSPEGDESDLHDYRTSICEFLDGKLNPSLGADQHVVESHRSGASSDVVVDDSVGILVEPVVSEGGQGRLRTRLDRFEDEYGLVLTVAVEVRDDAAWEELRDEYATNYGVAGTAYGFVSAPEVAPEPAERDRADEPASGGRSRLHDAVLLLLALPVFYLLLRLRFDTVGPGGFAGLGAGAVMAVVGVVAILLFLGIELDGEPGLTVGILLLVTGILLVAFCGYTLFSWAAADVEALSVETAGAVGAAFVLAFYVIASFGTSDLERLE